MSAAAFAALLALSVYVAAVVASHLLPTGIDPVRDALSHYAAGRRPAVAAVAGVANVIALVMLLVALAINPVAARQAPGGLGALGVMALTRVGTRLLPLDAPGRRVTSRWRAHALLAAVNVAASAVALRALTPALVALPAWRAYAPLLALTDRLVGPLLLVLAVCVLVRPLRRVFGLAERLFALDLTLWLAAVAVAASVARG